MKKYQVVLIRLYFNYKVGKSEVCILIVGHTRIMNSKLNSDFESKAGDPFFWFFMAKDMYFAAKTLWGKYEEMTHVYFSGMPKESATNIKLTPEQNKAKNYLRLKFPFLYLSGMAFENYLKGLLILRDPKLVGEGEINEEITSGHNLIKLFEKAGIELSSEEIHLVERIGDAVNWSSRYPVPKKAKDFCKKLVPGKGYTMPGNFMFGDELLVETLIGKVTTVIQFEYGVKSK
jgi:hypothetical protein